MRYSSKQLAERRRQKRKLLSQLGYRSYDRYLASKHWKRVKAAWKRAGMPQCCEVCGVKDYQLHHWTYRYLGREQQHLDCLQGLCEKHHREHHQAEQRGENITLTQAGRAFTRRRLDEARGAAYMVAPEPTSQELQEKYRASRTDQPRRLNNKKDRDYKPRSPKPKKKTTPKKITLLRVEVIAGPRKGYQGVILSQAGDQLMLRIDLGEGRTAPLEIDRKYVKVLKHS